MSFDKPFTYGTIRLQLMQIQKEQSVVSPDVLRNLSSKVYKRIGNEEMSQMGHISSPSNPPEVNLCTWAS